MNLLNKLKVVVWNIGFIEQEFSELMDSKEFKINWMKHSYNDRFFADPFMLEQNENLYIILAEEYLFVEAKGKIVKLIIDKKTKELKSRELLIETNYHLSYPFIWNDSIIAEQSAAGKWIEYDFNGNEKAVLSDVGFIDGTIFNNGQNEWLFATKADTEKVDANKKLYRYKLISGKPDIESEYLIKNSLVSSRPGGNFYKFRGKWYRIAQTSTTSIYGESISICLIHKCSDTEYEEETVKVISSHNEHRFNCGLHTFNVYRDVVVVDGFEMQIHPIQKLKNKLRG